MLQPGSLANGFAADKQGAFPCVCDKVRGARPQRWTPPRRVRSSGIQAADMMMASARGPLDADASRPKTPPAGDAADNAAVTVQGWRCEGGQGNQ